MLENLLARIRKSTEYFALLMPSIPPSSCAAETEPPQGRPVVAPDVESIGNSTTTPPPMLGAAVARLKSYL
jgi:hypothetical protein